MGSTRLRPALALCSAALLLGACGSGSTSPTAATPSTPATTTTAPSPSASLPPEAVSKQGGTYYGVFLAVTRTASDPALAAARAKAGERGYEGGDGELGCLRGAREQLKLPATGDYYAYSLLFDTEAQATAAASAFGSSVVGTAKVVAYCMD